VVGSNLFAQYQKKGSIFIDMILRKKGYLLHADSIVRILARLKSCLRGRLEFIRAMSKTANKTIKQKWYLNVRYAQRCHQQDVHCYQLA
jgi:hypothetical protein